MLNTFSKIILLFIFIPPLLQAQLVPIDERELSDMTGQAFMNIDTSSANGLDFTKLTLGLDVKTLLTSDMLELGNYTRNGTPGSDIKITDFALGSIDSNGKIVPFEIKDPFIELAFEDNAGKQDLVGIRLGFGGAKGVLSGQIQSLTGNINIDIRDTAAGLSNADNGLADLTAALLGNSPIEADAVLVNSDGTPNNIRATEIGIVNGETFDIVPTRGIDKFVLSIAAGLGIGGLNCVDSGFFSCGKAEITSNNCSAAGIDVCFELNTYNSLDIGKKQNDGTFEFSEGLFLGFQTKALTWVDGTTSTQATAGAFLNVPSGGLEVTLEQALLGTNRVRTRYADPYFGGN
ncbi:MAG: hypothetical protein JKY50_11415 [Oleispira sp.]|nr:hypothetical protein [Oleispira sp.]MBL4882473.1 hypothetical protein [Oleispira sp.]